MNKNKMEKEEFYLVRWEDDEFIIEFKGKPIGCTLTEESGTIILDWLRSYSKYLKTPKK